MACIAVGRRTMGVEVTVFEDREWWVCPVGGERCGRVLVDLGDMGLDALSWHVEHTHLAVLARRLGA